MKTTENARRAPIAALALIVAALAFSSCTEGPAGIFSSIASETPTNENMTKAIKTSSQSFVVHLGSTYYAGIGTLWKKADTANQWTPADTSAISSSTIFAGSAAVIGTNMYVAFFDSKTGDDLGVWSTTDGTAWVQVDSLAFPIIGDNLVRVLSANGTLFAVTTNERALTTDPAEYSIYYLNIGSFASAGILNDTTIGVPNSVAFDTDTAVYMFSAGDVLFEGSIGALGPTTTEPSTGGSSYSGVFAYNNGSNDGIIVSTKTGYLHYTTDAGATWLTAGPFKDSKGNAYSLSTPTYIAASNVLVVGTNRIPSSSSTPPVDGYLEFDMSSGFTTGMTPTDDHGIISNANNFDTSLTGRSVSAMPLIAPGVGFKLFALTDGYGLWSNTFDGTDWKLWVRE